MTPWAKIAGYQAYVLTLLGNFKKMYIQLLVLFLQNKMTAALISYTDSVRAFKERNKLGQFKQKTPEEIQKEKEKEQQEEAAAKAIAIGSRCEVTVHNQPSRRGVVMFVGKEVV